MSRHAHSGAPRRRPAALPRWQKWAVYGSGGALAASGALWLAAHFWWSASGEFGPAEHPAAHWALVAHGVAAYALLLALGSLAPLHVRVAWRLRRNVTSGLALATLLALLGASALWLYYGPLAGRDALSTAHWALGLAALPLLWLHRRIGRALRRG